jgi:hypothetical protein
VIIKLNNKFYKENLRVFVTFFTSGARPRPKNLGSGYDSSKMLSLHWLRVCNTIENECEFVNTGTTILMYNNYGILIVKNHL